MRRKLLQLPFEVWIITRHIADLPKVAGDPLAGFWGDDEAWADPWWTDRAQLVRFDAR